MKASMRRQYSKQRKGKPYMADVQQQTSRHTWTHILLPCVPMPAPHCRSPLMVPTAWDTTILWLSMTPLGTPVVPLV